MKPLLCIFTTIFYCSQIFAIDWEYSIQYPDGKEQKFKLEMKKAAAFKLEKTNWACVIDEGEERNEDKQKVEIRSLTCLYKVPTTKVSTNVACATNRLKPWITYLHLSENVEGKEVNFKVMLSCSI